MKDGKTLKLSAWHGHPAALPTVDGCVVPLGAVPKKLEPDKIWPVSDHTKTGLNGALDLSRVKEGGLVITVGGYSMPFNRGSS